VQCVIFHVFIDRLSQVLVPLESNPRPCWQFDAEIVVLFHSTTIRLNYQPVVQVRVHTHTPPPLPRIMMCSCCRCCR
jgi:GTPase